MTVIDNTGYAIAVTREETEWNLVPLGSDAITDIEVAVTQVRETRSAGASFGLINVQDDFFIILRPGPSGTRFFISDALAAIDYDVAADVLEELNVEVPDFDDEDEIDEDPWAEGDFTILADLGLTEDILGVIVDDYELFADEQILLIAEKLGFVDKLEKLIENHSWDA